MRIAIALLAALHLGACGPPQLLAGRPVLEPARLQREPAAIDSGRLIRVQLDSLTLVHGILLSPLRTATDSLRYRPLRRTWRGALREIERDSGPGEASTRLAVREVQGMWVSDPPIHGVLNAAVYGFMLLGAAVGPRDEDGDGSGGLILGMLVGFLVGAVLEQRTHYWTQVYPCPNRCITDEPDP